MQGVRGVPIRKYETIHMLKAPPFVTQLTSGKLIYCVDFNSERVNMYTLHECVS